MSGVLVRGHLHWRSCQGPRPTVSSKQFPSSTQHGINRRCKRGTKPTEPTHTLIDHSWGMACPLLTLKRSKVYRVVFQFFTISSPKAPPTKLFSFCPLAFGRSSKDSRRSFPITSNPLFCHKLHHHHHPPGGPVPLLLATKMPCHANQARLIAIHQVVQLARNDLLNSTILSM